VSALACAAPALAAPATTPSPRAALEGFVCQRASASLDRAIEVTAVMRPVTGTQRMEMKFVLLRRSAFAGPFRAVQGGDLGRWRQPNPATLGQRPSDVWKLKKLVVNLAAPSAYRFRVSFRWLGTAGTRLGRAVLFSPLCYQPR
jgi:hypothetical protein